MTSKLEYLKRYEGSNSSGKKKKRLKKSSNFTIFDDDINWKESVASQELLTEDPEDKPIVAQIQDDSIVKWQPLSSGKIDVRKSSPVFVSKSSSPQQQVSSPSMKSVDLSPPRRSSFSKKPIDQSPPKTLSSQKSVVLSPPRKRPSSVKSIDLSPPRKGRNDVNFTSCDLAENSSERKCFNTFQSTHQVDPRDLSVSGLSQLSKKRADLSPSRGSQIENITSAERHDLKSITEGSLGSGHHQKVNFGDQKVGLKVPKKILSKDGSQSISEESKKQFLEWGRGVTQTKDAIAKAINEEYEMSKPLARYADDEDLDQMLKERRREGDPMMLFMKKAKVRGKVSSNKGKPSYKGDGTANRFGLRPGYRWDGVDRSNGYEKVWLTNASNKKAVAEESYKWSIEDM